MSTRAELIQQRSKLITQIGDEETIMLESEDALPEIYYAAWERRDNAREQSRALLVRIMAMFGTPETTEG